MWAYCRGGRIDDDIGMCTSLAVVGVYVARAAVSPNVVPVCVTVSWCFSIPLVQPWRCMERGWGLGVWSQGARVC